MRKNIYVAEKDAELFQWAESYVSNLSHTVALALEHFRKQVTNNKQTEIIKAKSSSFDIDIQITITPKDVS